MAKATKKDTSKAVTKKAAAANKKAAAAAVQTTPTKKKARKGEQVAKVTPSKAINISLGRTFAVRTLLFVMILRTPTSFLLRQKVSKRRILNPPNHPTRRNPARQRPRIMWYSFGTSHRPVFCCGQWDTGSIWRGKNMCGQSFGTSSRFQRSHLKG